MGDAHRLTRAPTRRAAFVAVALAAAGAAACRRPPPDEPAEAGPPTARRVVPRDHLAPGELAEGTDVAFGLTLPRGVERTLSFPDAVHAASRDVGVDPLGLYVAARVRGAEGRKSADGVVFDGVHAGADDAKTLRVEVRPGAVGSGVLATLLVRDVTTREDTSPRDPAARMRDAGLSPDGRLLDPRALE